MPSAKVTWPSAPIIWVSASRVLTALKGLTRALPPPPMSGVLAVGPMTANWAWSAAFRGSVLF